MLGGVGDRDDAAVGVAEQIEALDAEVGAQLLEIGDVVGRLVGARVDGPVGALGAARVQLHEREGGTEAGKVAEVARREAGAARMADEQRALALALVREQPAVRRW